MGVFPELFLVGGEGADGIAVLTVNLTSQDLLCQGDKAASEIPSRAFLDAFFRESNHPFEQMGIVFAVELVEEVGDSSFKHTVGIEFHLVIARDIELAGKTTDDALEETVDGRDVER